MEDRYYDAFTRALTSSLEARGGVLGLVAVGSMAEGHDAWSDHDFFVITEHGLQEELRTDLSWLPHRERVVLAYRETDHGLQVVYDDGHLLEFAVFDLEELALAGINRRRVLFDRGGVHERVEEVAAATPTRRAPSDEQHFAKLVTLVLVATGRQRRGESLSALQLTGLARERLLALLARVRPDPRIDGLDPHRRFDLVHPALAADLAVADALDLLAIAERELRDVRPGLPWQVVDVVRARYSP